MFQSFRTATSTDCWRAMKTTQKKSQHQELTDDSNFYPFFKWYILILSKCACIFCFVSISVAFAHSLVHKVYLFQCFECYTFLFVVLQQKESNENNNNNGDFSVLFDSVCYYSSFFMYVCVYVLLRKILKKFCVNISYLDNAFTDMHPYIHTRIT